MHDLAESGEYGEVVCRWYRSGILSGKEGNRFGGGIKRCEVAVILCQLLRL